MSSPYLQRQRRTLTKAQKDAERRRKAYSKVHRDDTSGSVAVDEQPDFSDLSEETSD